MRMTFKNKSDTLNPIALLVLILLLAAPRILRILYPLVWIEDPNYIYAAFLIKSGLSPFHDFASPNLPLFEFILAGLYEIFGVSYRIAEIFTALTAVFTASCLFLGMNKLYKMHHVRSSKTHQFLFVWTAPLLYSLHPLIFRYHVFDREILTAAAAAAAFCLVADQNRKNSVDFLLLPVIFTLGFAGKQTMVVPLTAWMIFLMLDRSFSHALKTALFSCLGIALIYAIFTLIYGIETINQTFIFHFIKGANAPINIRIGWLFQALGCPLFSGALGLLILSFSNLKKYALLLILWLAAEIFFSVILSSTIWPHYLIPAIIPAALGTAVLSAETFHSLKNSLKMPIKKSALPLACFFAMLLLCAATFHFFPKKTKTAEKCGFNGLARSEVKRTADFIYDNTPPQQLIISAPFIALEAQRIKTVNFKDNLGLMRMLKESLQKNEFIKFKKSAAKMSFAALRRNSSRYWLNDIIENIKLGKISAVIPNYELPVSEEFLKNNGFSIQWRSENYQVWLKNKP